MKNNVVRFSRFNCPAVLTTAKTASSELMDAATKDEVRRLCIDGIQSSGEHHKQWALAEILRHVDHKTFSRFNRLGINLGIAP